MFIAKYEQGQFQPAWTKEAIEEFKKEGLINKKVSAKLDSFYNSDGSPFMTMSEFTFNNQPVGDIFDKLQANSCWVLTDKAIKVNDKCYGIKGIEYKIPYVKSDTTFTVESEGEPKILIKSDDGSINKLLTDEQLRQVTFEE